MDIDAKDCNCLTHEGPHWLHMDAFDKEQNKKLLEQAMRYKEDKNYSMCIATLQCYGSAEMRRLSEKLSVLKKKEQEEKDGRNETG